METPAPLLGGHIRALDGLRGVAIALVLIGHFYPKNLVIDSYPTIALFLGRLVRPSGYGVELFFVLSGFLITGILLDTKGERGFLGKFYARRTLRIFPLYYGALAVVLFVLPHFVVFDEGAKAIVERQAWLWTYLANWPTGWIWDDSNLFRLGHFWSLCVEEHFYIFWPLIVAFTSQRRIILVALGLIGIGLICRTVALIGGAETPVIFTWLTLQKLDGLAIGAMLATALRDPGLMRLVPSGPTYRRLLGAFVFLSFSYVMLPHRLHHQALDVMGETVIVIAFGLILLGTLHLRPGALWHRVMTSGSLVTLGKYSYGLYVIHGILRPAFERLFDFRHLPTSHGLSLFWMLLYYVLTISASLALAYLSYHGFEKWFLKLKRHFDYSAKGAA
ncbi:MAG: acyltransferase [Opitutaceae bacterium]|nr:acyltransferase [Opitutaceae bacterium]